MDSQPLEVGSPARTRPLKLLIVKFSSIGDCVMAVPVASVFRREFPEGQIVWAVDPRCAAVIATQPVVDPLGQSNRLVDEIFEIPWEQWKKHGAGPLGRVRHYLKLRGYGFDFGLDLQGHPKTAICLRLSGAKQRVAARAMDGAARVLNPVIPKTREHLAAGNLRALRCFGDFAQDESHIMPVTPPAPQPADVTITVSTGHPRKNYTRWGEVAQLLLNQGHSVAFLGGPGDSGPPVRGATDLVGKLPLVETMAMVRASKVHLAGDTGTGHIAGAYDVPVISIFGFTKSYEASPPGTKTTILEAGENMDGVTPEIVLEAAQRWLI